MNLQSTINHLEACLEQEVAAKAKAITWIDSMENAIKDHDSTAFAEIAAQGSDICRGDDRAAKRRVSLLGDLANHWSVPAGTLTLGSVVRRLEGKGARLDGLRKELRQSVANVMKRQRRLAALIGLHQRINADVMKVILGCDSHEEVNQGGALVNAEA